MPKNNEKKFSSVSRSRNWLLTVPNPSCDDILDHPDIIFCSYQIERGKSSENNPEGHRHMHIFVQFESQRHLNAVCKFFRYVGIVHADPCDLNAYFYVIKKPEDNGPWEEKDFSVEIPAKSFGRLPPGLARVIEKKKKNLSTTDKKESKLDKICKSLITQECSIDDIIISEPGIALVYKQKLIDFDLSLKKLKVKDEIWKPSVIWLYGSTGTGKTSSVYDFERDFFDNKPDDINVSGKDQAFINGYFGNDAVLIDETRGEIPYKDLLKLTDWNRGGKIVNMKCLKDGLWFPKRIYITSCYHPEDIYKGQMTKDDKIDQLLRRISLLCKVTPNAMVNDLPISSVFSNFFKSLDKNTPFEKNPSPTVFCDSSTIFDSDSSVGIKNPTTLESKFSQKHFSNIDSFKLSDFDLDNNII